MSEYATAYHNPGSLPRISESFFFGALHNLAKRGAAVYVHISNATSRKSRDLLHSMPSLKSFLGIQVLDPLSLRGDSISAVTTDFRILFLQLLEKGLTVPIIYIDFDRLTLANIYPSISRACSADLSFGGDTLHTWAREVEQMFEDPSIGMIFLERYSSMFLGYPDSQRYTELIINAVFGKAGIEARGVTAGILAFTPGALQAYIDFGERFPFPTDLKDVLALSVLLSKKRVIGVKTTGTNLGCFETREVSYGFRYTILRLADKLLQSFGFDSDTLKRLAINEIEQGRKDNSPDNWIKRLELAYNWVGNLRFALVELFDNTDFELIDSLNKLMSILYELKQRRLAVEKYGDTLITKLQQTYCLGGMSLIEYFDIEFH